MDNQQTSLTDLAWLAGIIDGEGWIGLSLAIDDRSKTRRTVVVKTEIKINNTDREIIARCQRIWKQIGVNPYYREYKYKAKAYRKPVYEVATKHMTGVLKLIDATLPYLTGNKLERAKLMKEFIKSRQVAGTIKVPDDHYTGQGPKALTAPYSEREVEIVEKCRALQSNGVSTTARRNRDEAVQDFKIRNQQYKELLGLGKIQSGSRSKD